MADLVSLNLSCAQPGEGHFINPTTVRSFLTLVERVAGFGKLFMVPEALRGDFLQQRLRLPSDQACRTLLSTIRKPGQALRELAAASPGHARDVRGSPRRFHRWRGPRQFPHSFQ